jgi:TRAP-type C4-dicarboxylate transport system substrate-binding protein
MKPKHYWQAARLSELYQIPLTRDKLNDKEGPMNGYVRKIFLCVCAITLFASFLPTTGFAAEATIRLKYSSFFPPTHLISELATQWCKELQERTNGRVTVAYFPAGTLVTGFQMFDGVVKGITDIGIAVTSYSPGRVPLTDVMYLPLGAKSAYQSSLMAKAFVEQLKPKEWDVVKLFSLTANGPGYFHTKGPVKKNDDLKGLRIKCDANSCQIVTAAGATPTTMPMMETYDALKRGLADGDCHSMEVLKGWKFGDSCKYTYVNHGMSYTAPFWIAMNKEKWNSLPKDIQQIIDKLNEEYFVKQARLFDSIDEDALDYTAKHMGHKVIYADPQEEAKMAQKMHPIFDEYLKDAKKQGLPGEEALNWCREFLKTAPVK